MKKAASTGRKRGANPLSRYMFWYAMAVLAFLCLALVPGTGRFVAAWAHPVMLVSGLCLLAWTVGEYRSGIVHGLLAYGQVTVIRRRKEPVIFFIWIVLYLLGSAMLVFAGSYIWLDG